MGKQTKKRNKKNNNKTKITIIALIILVVLILFGVNSEILNTVSRIAGLNITFEDKIEENKEEETNSTPVEFVADTNLKIYFIDVGQADSILITNGNDSMLIDAGNNDDGKNVVKFIQDKGIKKLNYLIRYTST